MMVRDSTARPIKPFEVAQTDVRVPAGRFEINRRALKAGKRTIAGRLPQRWFLPQRPDPDQGPRPATSIVQGIKVQTPAESRRSEEHSSIPSRQIPSSGLSGRSRAARRSSHRHRAINDRFADPPRLPPARFDGRGRSPDGDLRALPAKKEKIRARDPARRAGDLLTSPLLPLQGRVRPAEQGRQADADHRLRAGDPALVLPLVVDARRHPARPRPRRQAQGRCGAGER